MARTGFSWRPNLGSLAVLVAACALAAGGTVAAAQHPPVEELKTTTATIATAGSGSGNVTALMKNGAIQQQLRCTLDGGLTEATVWVRTTGQAAWLSSSSKLTTSFTYVAVADSSHGDGGATVRSTYDVLLDGGGIQHYVVDIGASVLGVACWARVAALSD